MRPVGCEASANTEEEQQSRYQKQYQVCPRKIARHRKLHKNEEVGVERCNGEQETQPERPIKTSNRHRLELHQHLETTISHALYFERHWTTIHHLLHAWVAHDFLIHPVAILARLVNDKGEERYFSRLNFSGLGERNTPVVLEIVTNRLDVFECAMLFPNLPCFLSDAFVKFDVLLRHRYNKSID